MANVFVEEQNLQDIADAIREKNGTDDTYKPSEMGSAIRRIESGGGDIYEFGIQNEVKGTNLVTLDYVNENEHNVEVQLSSDTITDFSRVEVKCIGKNLWNKEYARDVNNWVGLGWYPCIPIYVGKGATISVSYQQDLPTGLGLFVAFSIDGTEVGARNKWLYHSSSAGSTSKTRTFIAENDYIYLCSASVNVNYVFLNNFMENIGNDLQIEISNVVTDYESYTEKTYIANANGTVDGIKSASPIMHLMCDGVDISAKYYQRPSAEYDRFWDNYQVNGNRTDYVCGFGGKGWTKETFKPKYDIRPTVASSMFQDSNASCDLVALLNECGVELDFSNCNGGIASLFQKSAFTHVGVIDASKCPNANYIFNQSKVVVVDEFILSESVEQSLSAAFSSASYLEEIRFKGKIRVNLSMVHCTKLSVESVQSAIDALADLTGQTSLTVAFQVTVKANLTDEQIASITAKNWTLA